MNILAIIPARGGSKGIPYKNIAPVAGKPLIAWSIMAARSCPEITHCLVSTDDERIGEVASEWGCGVLRRPRELATDESPMSVVVMHALAEAERINGISYDIFLLLQPTAPMRTPTDITNALSEMNDSSINSLISVYPVGSDHPQLMFRLEGDILVPFAGVPSATRRQDFPPVFHRNGAIYACRAGLAKEEGKLLHDPIRPFIMPAARSVNIDEWHDLLLADILMRRQYEIPGGAGGQGSNQR